MRALIHGMFLIFCVAGQAAQVSFNNPEQLFGITNLWKIQLLLNRTEWQELLTRSAPEGENLSWSSCTFHCADLTLTNVGIRFKGKVHAIVSEMNFKHSFKIDFNRRHKGRTFCGLKEFSLNDNSKDPTRFREALAYDVCRAADLPTPRTAFAEVYISVPGLTMDRYLGVYTIVETVDTDFLKAHFGSDKGLLLKPEGLNGLEYLGENWAEYISKYRPKTTAKSAETRRLVELTQLVSQADDATLERELPRHVDLDNLLRYLAAMAALGNFESFGGTGDNYYLFLPAKNGQALFIPWDLDGAFGGSSKTGSRSEQTELTVLHWPNSKNRLVERILANPKWAISYRQQVHSLLTNSFDSARLATIIHQMTQVLQQAVFAESNTAKTKFQHSVLGNRPDRVEKAKTKETLNISDWIKVRGENIAEELTGKRTGGTLR